MTGQISDTIFYKDKLFCLVGTNGGDLFNPTNYGIKPVIKSHTCYRGFCCEYLINEDCLKLNKVYLGLDYKNFLLIKYDRGGQKLFGRLPHKHNNMFGLHQYDGQNIIIEFTGGLLIGKDYIRGLGSNGGSAPPYIFKQAIELIFQSGRLVTSINRSQEMSELREFIDFDSWKRLSNEGRDKVRRWIEEGRLPDYKII